MLKVTFQVTTPGAEYAVYDWVVLSAQIRIPTALILGGSETSVTRLRE